MEGLGAGCACVCFCLSPSLSLSPCVCVRAPFVKTTSGFDEPPQSPDETLMLRLTHTHTHICILAYAYVGQAARDTYLSRCLLRMQAYTCGLCPCCYHSPRWLHETTARLMTWILGAARAFSPSRAIFDMKKIRNFYYKKWCLLACGAFLLGLYVKIFKRICFIALTQNQSR